MVLLIGKVLKKTFLIISTLRFPVIWSCCWKLSYACLIKFRFFFFPLSVRTLSLETPWTLHLRRALRNLPSFFPFHAFQSFLVLHFPKGELKNHLSFWNMVVPAFVLFCCLVTSVLLQDAEYRCSVGWGKRRLRFLKLTFWRQSNKLWKFITISLNVRTYKCSCSIAALSSSCTICNVTFCKQFYVWSCRTGNLQYEILYGVQIWN